VYDQVVTGLDFSCGLRSSDGRIRCWGNNNQEQIQAPTGAYVEIAAGGQTACALTGGGQIACWGANDSNMDVVPAGVTFTRVVGLQQNFCGITDAGTLLCWGSGLTGVTNEPAGQYRDLWGGYSHACAIRNDGQSVCWGFSQGVTTVPAGALQNQAMVVPGSSHACALSNAGVVTCWGQNNGGSTIPNAGTYAFIDSFNRGTCGIRTNGSVACWGDAGYAEGGIVDMDISSGFGCGRDAQGHAVCWSQGGAVNGQDLPPCEE
jgi:alpha-tubulin suppressor-like RCC1 family protein